MKKFTVLTLILLSAAFLFTSCEPPATNDPDDCPELPDLTGMLTINGSGEDWVTDVTGTAEYYREGMVSEIGYDVWSAESVMPSLNVVSWADIESDEYAAHPKFLYARQGYGNGKFGWRIYPVDPDSTDNGFVGAVTEDDVVVTPGDNVKVSIDVWVPDMTAYGISEGAWFELSMKNSSAGGTIGSYTAEELVVKFDADNTSATADDFANGTDGWETFEFVVEEVVDVIDIKVTMGNLSNSKTWIAYFDNLKVEKVAE